MSPVEISSRKEYTLEHSLRSQCVSRRRPNARIQIVPHSAPHEAPPWPGASSRRTAQRVVGGGVAALAGAQHAGGRHLDRELSHGRHHSGRQQSDGSLASTGGASTRGQAPGIRQSAGARRAPHSARKGTPGLPITSAMAEPVRQEMAQGLARKLGVDATSERVAARIAAAEEKREQGRDTAAAAAAALHTELQQEPRGRRQAGGNRQRVRGMGPARLDRSRLTSAAPELAKRTARVYQPHAWHIGGFRKKKVGQGAVGRVR
jgi:hypothetical protein